MKLDVRTTHKFADISVDSVNTTIFYSDEQEVEDFINNLIFVADVLADKTDRNLLERVQEFYSY